METELLAYFLATAIGVSLGLIGAGGSILTVPVLVYLAGVNPVLATAYSLFVVGTTALAGGVEHFRKGRIDFKTALIFGIPSIAAVYFSRAFIMPAIPADIAVLALEFTKESAILVFFALLMIVTSVTMIRGNGKEPDEVGRLESGYRLPLIAVEGLGVGVLTGLVGAGGGFLIVPALVLLAGLGMKVAVGTSLVIIAAKSLIGFIGDIQAGYEFDWAFLLTFTAFSIAGIYIGARLGRRIDGKKLKKGFGWFVLVMGLYMVLKEVM